MLRAGCRGGSANRVRPPGSARPSRLMGVRAPGDGARERAGRALRGGAGWKSHRCSSAAARWVCWRGERASPVGRPPARQPEPQRERREGRGPRRRSPEGRSCRGRRRACRAGPALPQPPRPSGRAGPPLAGGCQEGGGSAAPAAVPRSPPWPRPARLLRHSAGSLARLGCRTRRRGPAAPAPPGPSPRPAPPGTRTRSAPARRVGALPGPPRREEGARRPRPRPSLPPGPALGGRRRGAGLPGGARRLRPSHDPPASPGGRDAMASEPPAPSARVTTRTGTRLTAGPWKRPAAASPRSPTGPGAASGWSRFWEGQDVLARWTDGLLYLGTIKKVDPLRQVCLVQFEDDSQFLVLWKDINPAAVPGEEQVCCVCHSDAVSPENRLVRCEKCSHAYHQECHLPRVLSDGAWMCRQCVFAVATKRGGALKKGPYAKAMLAMKLMLPYQLRALEWDAEHLANRQQCYCYCGGPGEWNLKMLQCQQCAQWFHEACTQCLSKPLLYGDRFYIFVCCVCTGGPESVRRLPLRWVDVAHLILYHLSICCKKKYFDFEREILPFASENWDSLLLGELSDTPKGERYSELLSALTSHKDRFISGKEIKKRKGLFGLHLRLPPPAPLAPGGQSGDSRPSLIPESSFLSGQGRRGKGPERRRVRRRQQRGGREPALSMEYHSTRERDRLERALTQEVVRNAGSANQSYGSYGGISSTYNFRRTDARCQDSSPIRMFASFHPSANTAGTLSTSRGAALDPHDAFAEHESPEGPAPLLPCTASAKRPAQPPASSTLCVPASAPHSSTYFGAMGRLARGEAVRILARRVTTDGTVQYLVEWDGGGMF